MRSLVAIALVAIGTLAQAQVSEVIEVRVANVDVVVVDKAGKPIVGLTKEDFQLFENGKQQPLTNFYEMRTQTLTAASDATAAVAAPAAAPEPPAEARKRSIVVFLDATSIAVFSRNKAIDSIQRMLSTLVRDGDDAMIVNWTRGLEVVQPFTGDRAALDRALEGMRKKIANSAAVNFDKRRVVSAGENNIRTSIQSKGIYPMQKAYDDTMDMWRNYAADLRANQSNLMGIVTHMFSVLAGSDRKKVFLFLGGELEESPGVDVLNVVDSMFQQQGIRIESPPQLEAADNGLSTKLRVLSEKASADGITMYMVDVGDRHIDTSLPTDPSVDFLSDANTIMSMGLLAGATGGAVLNGTMNFDNALRDVSRDLDSYYSLGYKPNDGPKQRKIAVKVKRPGAKVRSRQYYALKSSDEQVADSVVANVFHDGMTGDFPVTVTAEAAQSGEKNTFSVPVTITFPSGLTYLPDGDKMVGEYAVVFVTASPDGGISPITKQVHKVSFPAGREDEVLKKPFTQTATLVVKPGKQSVSVAIVDRAGARTGYGKVTFTAE
jgi:VWFA-related protein